MDGKLRVVIKEQEKRKFLRVEENVVFIEDIPINELIEMGSVEMNNGYMTTQFAKHPVKVEAYISLKFSDMYFMEILHLRQKNYFVNNLRRSTLINEFGFSQGSITRAHTRLRKAGLIKITKTFDNNLIYEILNKKLFDGYCEPITPFLLCNKVLKIEHKGFILKIWEHILEDIDDHISYGSEKLAELIGSSKPTVIKMIREIKSLGYIESRDEGGFNISKKKLLFDMEKWIMNHYRNVI
jgi:Mn-dependent DtxR family transcriptional regulator